MTSNIEPDPVPLRADERGGLRVGDSRVSLDTLLHEYENGADPEGIVNAYPTLRLADVYAVIAYCLTHPDDVQTYLRRRRQEAAELRRDIESRQPGRWGHAAACWRGATPRSRAMLPLAADEDVNGNIIRGLRRREPGIDLVRVRDVFPDHTPDPVVLEWAADSGRVLVTQDENTMVGYAWDRVKAGLPMPGVIVRGTGVTIRPAIDDLLLAARCGIADDFKDQVQFLPL